MRQNIYLRFEGVVLKYKRYPKPHDSSNIQLRTTLHIVVLANP